MEAIRDQKSTLKNTRVHIGMIDLSNMNQSDQNKIDQAICIGYAISILESLLPKEEKEIKTDVEFLCKWCSNEKLMNIFQEEAQEMQDTLAWKKALLETFKTESDEQAEINQSRD